MHISPLTASWYLPMNTNLPPFNNLKARQPVSYAIDRNAAVKIFGGANLQRLPARSPAHLPRPQGLLPVHEESGHALVGAGHGQGEGARQGVGHRGAKGDLRVVRRRGEQGDGRLRAERAQSARLQSEGQPISANISFTYPQNTKNKVQINVQQWYQDYPAASDFLYVLFGCESFHPGSDSSINMAGFCNKKINAQMHKALKLAVTNVQQANVMWARSTRWCGPGSD